MTVVNFGKNENAHIRSTILKMEDLILSLNQNAKSLGLTEAICFQMGKTTLAAQNVANALRDLLRETEELEKLSPDTH